MLAEVIDLSVGLGIAVLPMLLLAVPGIIVFVVLPAIVLAALVVPLAALCALVTAPLYLVARRRRTVSRPAGLRQRAAVG